MAVFAYLCRCNANRYTMKKQILAIIAGLLLVQGIYAATAPVDSLLSVLDKEIGNASVYLEQRAQEIEEVRALPYSAEQQLRLAELYKPYQSDSAVTCLERLLNDGKYRLRAKVELLDIFSSIGLFAESFRLANAIGEVPESLRFRYYEAMSRLYSWAANNCKTQLNRQNYAQTGRIYLDSLYAEAMRLPRCTERYNVEVMRYREYGNHRAALQANDSLFTLLTEDTHDYALYAYQRYLIYKDLQQPDIAEQWLIRAAITDIRCAVTDNGASWILANHLYKDGDIERANHYIEYSLQNAAFFNAPLRYIQMNQLAHLITQTYQQRQQETQQRLTWALYAVALCLLLLIVFAAYTLHQNKALQRLAKARETLNRQLQEMHEKQKELNRQLQESNHSLREANNLKQQYICRFLIIYSEYIRRLSKMARRAGERDTDIFLAQEMQKFYNTFDETFLSIYPNFVQDFNGLLVEQERIATKPSEKLTTELRIYALVCLGIDSVGQIAELLCYSASTIYNYRVRIKNNALNPHENFDEQVKRLGKQEVH